MSEKPYDKKALIQYRMERAHESLDDARLMLAQKGSNASIVNRAYYAMFYAALALLITIDKGSSKHQGVIALFDENFIKTNVLPKELGKLFHRAFDMRQSGGTCIACYPLRQAAGSREFVKEGGVSPNFWSLTKNSKMGMAC